MKIKWTKATEARVKNITDRFNQYDAIFLMGLILSLVAGHYEYKTFEAFFFGLLIYGAINTVVKTARPDVTVIVLDGKVTATTENDHE